MINPSGKGWIAKWKITMQKADSTPLFVALEDWYLAVRQSGFVYGHIRYPLTDYDWGWMRFNAEEKAKLSMLLVQYHLYQTYTKHSNVDAFLNSLHAFYRSINPAENSIWSLFMPAPTRDEELENFLQLRSQTNANLLTKNFSHVVINALLFIDVLAYGRYLEHGKVDAAYIRESERILLQLITTAVEKKQAPTPYDRLILKLLKASVRYTKWDGKAFEATEIDPNTWGPIERRYALDMAAMVAWNDENLDLSEAHFIKELGKKLDLSPEWVSQSLQSIATFIEKYHHEIPYFQYSNPVKHFYDNLTDQVQQLLVRNKKRLVQEISESTELMSLLAQSTQRDLSPSEKKKVRKQLLDVFKSIPSLTIFLLPGGGILLPIVIKFIPSLLPSSFNENEITDEENA